MELIFIQLAVILFTAFILSYIAKFFKQPIVIGYLLAGIIISPFIISFGASTEIIKLFSEFGIAFLLFIVGLHMNPKVLKEVGISSLIIGILQVILTFILGFLVSFKALGFDLITSAYIGIALAFSSTIIIMKLLSDKRQIDSLYGKLSVGILILQDLIAIFALMFISSVSVGAGFKELITKSLISGGGLLVGLFLVAYLILPRLTKNVARYQELLFLFSICWCFVIAALFSYFGFSIEIGALLAGISLSISPYSTEISSKIRPLRDFFLIIFFIILGLGVNISNVGSIIVNALIFSLIALVFKPLVIMTLMAFFRYTKRNNFLVGTTLGQISEFSLILLALGVAMNHIAPEILATITLTGLITITLSTYTIMFSNQIYNVFSKRISIFERKHTRLETIEDKKYDTILFGYNRLGFGILKALKSLRKKYLIVDFNPDVISDLHKLGLPGVYGDAYDTDFLNELPLEKAQMAISTVPDFETNLILIEYIRSVNPESIVISRASSIEDAFELYKKGANYVLTPHFLGGEYLSKMLSDSKLDKDIFQKEKTKHIKMLEERQTKIQKRLDFEVSN